MPPVKTAPRPTGLLSFGVLKSSPSVKLKQDHTPRRSVKFDRFEGLANDLVQVPKSEIDEKRKEA